MFLDKRLICVHMTSQAIFSRLLLLEPGNHLIYMTSCSVVNLSADRDAGEKLAIPYLYACYQRAKEEVGYVELSDINSDQSQVKMYIKVYFKMSQAVMRSHVILQ